MISLSYFRCAVGALLLLLFPAPALAGRKALLIGNGAYAISPLSDPVHDVDLVHEAFGQLGFTTYKYEDLTQKGLRSAFEAFHSQIESGDEVVIFYGGHGIQIAGEHYILPVDFTAKRASEFKDQTLSVEWLLERIEQAGANLSVVFLDSCRTKLELLEQDISALPSRSHGAPGGARSATSFSNVMIFFSTKHGEPAFDGPGNHSLFASALARELLVAEQPLMTTLQKVTTNVIADSTSLGVPQQPYFYGSLGKEIVWLREVVSAAPMVVNTPPVIHPVEDPRQKMIVSYTGRDGVNIRDSRNVNSTRNLHGALFQQTRYPLRHVGESVIEDGREWVQLEVTGWITVKNINNVYLEPLGNKQWKVVWNRKGDNFVAMRTGLSTSEPIVCKVAYATVLEELDNDFSDPDYKYIFAQFTGWAVRKTPYQEFIRPFYGE